MSGPTRSRLRRGAARLAAGLCALVLVVFAAVDVTLAAPRLAESTGGAGVHGRFLREDCPPPDERPAGRCGRFTPDGGEPVRCCTIEADPTGRLGEIEVRCADGRCHEIGARATARVLGLLLAGVAALPVGALLSATALGRPPGGPFKLTAGTVLVLLLMAVCACFAFAVS
ncbi:hypothetical protein ACFVFS_24735 [Kitasatospora sp. NPDC057692]|uniref:hypothetical protein n=1 Tax=Kitasatospora sp. NPDC057692 TaxID=3346215 RepID=UPI0036A2FB0F